MRSKGVMMCELGGLKSAAYRLRVRSTWVQVSWLTDALELRIICFRQSLASGDFFLSTPLSLCSGRHIKADLSQEPRSNTPFPTPLLSSPLFL